MLITIEGLVTKSMNIGDNNKLISVLTKDRGIIYAFINNCKKMDSKILAASELLSYCQFILFKNKEKYTVNEAQVLKQFKGIRADIVKLALGCYFIELIHEISGEGQVSEDYLRLILNSLYVLDSDKRDILTVKAVTELKIVSIAGYMPNLVCCQKCLTTDFKDGVLFLMSGELICNKCRVQGETKGVLISQGVLSAMRYIIYSDISKIYSFKLSQEDINLLSKIAQDYLLFKTELNLSKLKYFNKIMSFENIR